MWSDRTCVRNYKRDRKTKDGAIEHAFAPGKPYRERHLRGSNAGARHPNNYNGGEWSNYHAARFPTLWESRFFGVWSSLYVNIVAIA